MGHTIDAVRDLVNIRAEDPNPQRRVIPRAKAAFVVSIAGLAVSGIGALCFDALASGYAAPESPPAWLVFFPHAFVTTGLAAVVASAILALFGLLPWKPGVSKYAALALGVDLLALLWI